MTHTKWINIKRSLKALSSSCNGMKISKSSLCWEFWFVILNFSSIFWNFGRFSLDLWESHSMASPNNSFSHEQHVSNKSRNCLGRDQSHDKINLLIGANPRPIGELWVFLIFTYHFYRGTHIEQVSITACWVSVAIDGNVNVKLYLGLYGKLGIFIDIIISSGRKSTCRKYMS